MRLFISACIVAVFLLVIAMSVQADQNLGTVVSSQPNTEVQMVPQQTCTQITTQSQQVQQVYQQPNISGLNAGRVIGSIAGGAIGSRFGHGNGQIASVMAGTALGGVVGSHIYGQMQSQPQTVITTQPQVQNVCNTTMVQHSVTRGYLVTIDFNGTTFTQLLSYNPPVGTKVVVNLSAQ